MVRDGPADLMKGGDGEGSTEQFKPHRLPDRLALFAVELLLAGFGELFPFRLHDPEPEEGRGDRLPVDAEGKEHVPPLGVGGIGKIRIEAVFQGGPARRFFVRRAPDGLKGVSPDPLVEKFGEMVRQGADNAITRKCDRSLQ